jgi:phosphoglycerate dehydrogenase-like enzyme
MHRTPAANRFARTAFALVAFALAAGCGAPQSQPAKTTASEVESQPASANSAGEEFGSLRNARVAFERPSGTLTYFAGPLDPEQLDELAKLAPNVRVVAGLSREQALERAAEAHGIEARFAAPEFLSRATNLVWVQAMSAGVDRYMGLAPLVENERIVLTNQRGAHGPAIADHCFAMLLTLTRDLRFFADQQREQKWAREGSGTQPFALEGRTMFVVGLGGIGTEVAERAHGFGMRVIATRRSGSDNPAFVERVGKPEELLAMLPEADVVALCVPLTPETESLFDARAFAALKPGAILINIARGKVVDTQALLEALDSGRLGGACLDVTEPEPLPADHPLWRAKNVVITPHVAADAELTFERTWSLLCENVRRFGAGEPLLNVVDKRAGY